MLENYPGSDDAYVHKSPNHVLLPFEDLSCGHGVVT